ncbi:MAG: ATP-binding protein [Verrucomicrobiia bacterium]
MNAISNFIFVLPPQSLKVALLVSFFSVWVLIGIFFYLNYYTRRRYFTIWATGWLFYSIWLVLSYYIQDRGENNLLLMLRLWCVSATASLFFWGSARFLGHHLNQRLVGLFILFLFVWSFVGAYFLDDYWQVRIPIYSLICIASLRISWCFFAYRRHHPYIGAGLLAFGFFLWGISNILYPIMQRINDVHSVSYIISAVVQLFIAVSMIVLVLEEGRTIRSRILTQVFEKQDETNFLKKSIKATEERYRILFEQAAEAIIITDVENLEIIDLNKAAEKILDVQSVEDARKYFLNEFCYVDEQQSSLLKSGDEWVKYLCSQRPLYLKQKSGGIVAVEVDCSAVRFGEKNAYQFFIRELTERARLEQQLRQAEKLAALGQMISGVAHELNNPLSVVKGYLEVILKSHDLSPQTRADLEKVAKESDRAINLVKNFLTFAQKRALKRDPININEIIKDVMDLRKFTTKIAKVEVKYDLLPALPITLADPEQIKQVVVILVNNALQAMEKCPPPHRLNLRTSLVDNMIRVEVQDNGPGVPPHLEERIFEPFFTTKEVGAGTGLGLSIAHSIIAEHKGKIYHRRPSEGGACFVFEIPVVAPEVSQGTVSEQTAPELKPASYPASVLVVDDEPAVEDMIAEILQLIGYTPFKCNSAIEALAILEQKDFDVILSDIRMPGMDGKQFYERLKVQKPKYAERVIFLTGDTINKETQDFLNSTGNLHLPKPFQLAAVQEAVEKVLKQIKARQPADTQA